MSLCTYPLLFGSFICSGKKSCLVSNAASNCNGFGFSCHCLAFSIAEFSVFQTQPPLYHYYTSSCNKLDSALIGLTSLYFYFVASVLHIFSRFSFLNWCGLFSILPHYFLSSFLLWIRGLQLRWLIWPRLQKLLL